MFHVLFWFINKHHKFAVASFEALPRGMKSDVFDRRVMERGTNNSEPARTGSFSRTSSLGSSLRKRSLSISSVVSAQIDDDIHSETVSEAGDIGDRALQSNRHSVSSSVRLSVDCAMETGTVIHPAELNTISLVSPLPEDITFPLPIDPLKCSEDKRQVSFQLIVSAWCDCQ